MRKIHCLHLTCLIWSALPLELPDCKLFFVPIITNDDQMHMFCEDGIHQIHLSNQPRLL